MTIACTDAAPRVLTAQAAAKISIIVKKDRLTGYITLRQLIGGEMRNRKEMLEMLLKLKKFKMLIIQEHLRQIQSGSTFTETFTCNLLCSALS